MEMCKNNPIVEGSVVEKIKNDILLFGIALFNRQFPSAQDGMKPIFRRIIWSCYLHNCNKPTKLPKLSGYVSGFHPHGESSILDAIYNMAQDRITQNHALLVPIGQFGNTINLVGAAARYVETKLSDFAHDVCISLIDEKCLVMIPGEIDFEDKEPEYLPTKIPMVLVNGIMGIAESFTSDIPPHNLKDISDIVIRYIKNKNISPSELSKGLYPDYCTGGIIINGDDIANNYTGGVAVAGKYRGNVTIDNVKNRIIIESLPNRYDSDGFQDGVKKLINEKDSSNNPKYTIFNGLVTGEEVRNGKNTIYVQCKSGSNLLDILESLYKNTCLQVPIKYNFNTQYGDTIKRCSLKDIIQDWYKANYTYRRKKLTNDRNNLEINTHILEGIYSVYDHIDEIISIIRKFQGTDDELVEKIRLKFKLSPVQARAICKMQLNSLSKRSKVDLLNKINKNRATIETIKVNITRIDDIMIEDIVALSKKYYYPRSTKIISRIEDKQEASISNGSILASRNSIGIFDIDNVISGKRIINGFKGVRIDGTWVKEIVNSHVISSDLAEVLVVYNNGYANTQPLPSSINCWMSNLNSESNGHIRCVIPVYKSKKGTVVCILDDGSLKRFSVDDIGVRVVNTSSIIKNCIHVPEDKENSNLLLVNKNNEYMYIKIKDIPVKGRTSQGVQSGYSNGDGVSMTLCDTDSTHCVVLLEDTKVHDGHAFTIPLDTLKTTNRTSKLKKLHGFTEYVCNGVSVTNLSNKDSLGIFISDTATNSLKISNLKGLKLPRKVNSRAINFQTIEL